jgi:hypothetical protein
VSSARPTTREIFFGKSASPELQERLEREFFSRVALPDGTLKTTYSRRLDDLNRMTLPHLRRLGPGPLRITDVAASSAISTLEWQDFLQAAGVACQVSAGDRLFQASLVRVVRGFEALIDGEGNVLHLDLLGRGLPPRAPGLRGWVTALLGGALGLALHLERHALAPAAGSSRQTRWLRSQPVLLASRRVIERGSVELMEDDLLAQNRAEQLGACHVIRAANILNRGYFPDPVLARMITTLRERLRPEGLLIVCRTDARGGNHASLFQWQSSSRFRLLERLGAGSEIEDLVLTASSRADQNTNTL